MMLVSAMWRSLNRQEEYMQDPSKHPKMRNSIRAQSDKMKKESMALEKRMDPLLARREWNNKHALLSRLPDELILTIIEDYVRDPSDLFVMSRVCRKFRYLILFKTGILRGSPLSGDMDGQDLIELFQLQQKMRRDLMCFQCTKLYRPFMSNPFCDVGPELVALIQEWGHNNTPQDPQSADALRDRIATENLYWEQKPNASCPFMEKPTRWVDCGGCKLLHPTMAFSPTEQCKDSKSRVCIGWEGAVRLCEHRTISWNDILLRIRAARGRGPRSWDRVLKAMRKIEFVCEDESHLFPCRFDRSSSNPDGHDAADDRYPWYEPSFPRAKLVVVNQVGDPRKLRLSLKMTWRPHSGTLQWPLKEKVQQLQTDVAGVRDVSEFFGQRGARFIVPERIPGSPPEMLCFDPNTCGCLRYETGREPEGVREEGESAVTLGQRPKCGNEAIWTLHKQVAHQLQTRHYYTFEQDGRNTSKIEIFQCRNPDNKKKNKKQKASTSRCCTVTCYERNIFVGKITYKEFCRPYRMLQDGPNHEWFHAVDRDSYERATNVPRGNAYTYIRPSCDQKDCTRYYRLPTACGDVEATKRTDFLSLPSDKPPPGDAGVKEHGWVIPRIEWRIRNAVKLYRQYGRETLYALCLWVSVRRLRRSLDIILSVLFVIKVWGLYWESRTGHEKT